MSDPTPVASWGVPGLAQLFDIVLDAAAERRELSLSESDQFFRAGHLGAEAGLTLSGLIEAYLGGAGELWEQVFASTDPAHRVEVGRALRQVSERAVAGLASGFEAAQRRSIRALESSRREFLDDLLSDGAARNLSDERAHRVDFALADRYVTAVVDADFQFSDTGPIHGRVRAELSSRAPERRFEVFTRSGRLIVVAPDHGPGDLGVLVETMGGVEGLDWRLGIGGAAQGLAGIVTSYRQALEAIRLMHLFDRGPTARFDELLAHRMMAADAETATLLVRSIIDPLASMPRLDLVTTLQSFVANGQNMAEVARDLNLGARTVAYRLDRIAALTGHSPRDPDGRFVLEMALRCRPLAR